MRRLGEYKQLKGTLSIGCPSGGDLDTEDIFVLTLEDETSGIIIAEVEIEVGEMALALASRGNRPCTVNLIPPFNQAYLGQFIAVKQEDIRFPKLPYNDDALPIIKKVLEPYEIDGWKARYSDAQNHHHVVKGSRHDDGSCLMTISFSRYQPEPPDERSERGTLPRRGRRMDK